MLKYVKERERALGGEKCVSQGMVLGTWRRAETRSLIPKIRVLKNLNFIQWLLESSRSF